MRLLRKLVMKFVTLVAMVALMGGGMRYGQRYLKQATGAPATEGVETPKFSSEEADLMSTVFRSALRLFTGSASRDELASELSDKLYAGRAAAGDMSELGIELVKPGADSPAPDGIKPAGGPAIPAGAKLEPGSSALPGAASIAKSALGAKLPVNQRALPSASPAPPPDARTALVDKVWKQMKANSIELGLIPIVLFGMVVVHRIRQRGSQVEGFVPPGMTIQPPAESEPYDMKHAVHSLKSEDFELLVALIYQRQGYRVSMPAGLSGGRGGDFTLARKSEKLLVQCKRLNQEHRVDVDRVRELHEAATAAGARGLYVASCGFTWDARNFAKTKKVMLINARTLDELLTAARETPDEDLLAVSQWVPKLMSKVQLTPPHCPACEAAMDQLNVSHGSVWVCSQRPECRGRRSSRQHQKTVPTAARKTDLHTDGATS